MTEYVSVREALIRDIESAEAASTMANESYAAAERTLDQAQGSAARTYERRATRQRNVDRLKKALAIIDGDTDG